MRSAIVLPETSTDTCTKNIQRECHACAIEHTDADTRLYFFPDTDSMVGINSLEFNSVPVKRAVTRFVTEVVEDVE